MAREYEKIRLTRQQVARREIDSAISLLLTDGEAFVLGKACTFGRSFAPTDAGWPDE